jgi:hypothetical protein
MMSSVNSVRTKLEVYRSRDKMVGGVVSTHPASMMLALVRTDAPNN